MTRIMALRDNGVYSELLIAVLPTGGGKSVFFILPVVLNGVGKEETRPFDRDVLSLDELVYLGRAVSLNGSDQLVYSSRGTSLNLLDQLV
jgi:hypothetical protein